MEKKKVKLLKANSDDFWKWWAKTSPPQNKKEYKPPIVGDIKKGGGSRSKGRKKPKKGYKIGWKWEEL